MEVYRGFTRQTDAVVQYLSVARQYEHHTRVEVPKLKHAPVNLGRQLEDYLSDPDFEIHRRQYLAELEAKKGKGGSGATASKPFKSTTETPSKPAANNPFPSVNGAASTTDSKPASKGPDTDLIDFFDSIEQNQTPLGAPPAPAPQGASPWGNAGFQPQPTGFQPQPTGFQNGFAPQQTGFQATNPFQQQMTGFPQQQQQQAPPPQLQPSFTGAGFGGFTAQQSGFQSSLAPIPQESVASFQTGASSMSNPQQQQQITNPFRASMMMTGQPTGMQQPQQQPAFTGPPAPLQPQQTSTNPFARASPNGAQPFAAPPSNPSQPPQAAPLQPMATGTNPFAKNFGAPQQAQRPATSAGTLLAPQPTGTTNPFRQSQFVNHNTGMGWQHQQQPMGGGLDNLQTIPVFPRPTTQSPWQQ